MFGWARDFYRRNRRKLLITGVVVGGACALGKYVSWKVDEWQKAKAEDMETAAKMQFHFENNQKTCSSTFISFLPNIRNMIMEKLNTEELLAVLKLKPDNKLEIWEELKLMSASRVVCSLVANVLLLVLLKVKMNVLGGYMFAVSKHDGDNEEDMSKIQLKYLNNVRYLIEEKLPILIGDCLGVVSLTLRDVSLKDKISHQRLKELFIEIIKTLKNKYASISSNKHELCAYMVDPAWSESGDGSEIYTQMISETVDILESIDCSLVLDTCLNSGLEQILGKLESYFRSYDVVMHDDTEDTITVEKCIKKEFHTTLLPVAKIIPILNSQIHEIFKAGENELFDALFSQDLIRELSKNIYDSVSKKYP